MPSCRGSCRSWRRLLLLGGLLSLVLLAGAPDVALAGSPDRVLPAPQLKIMPEYVPGEVIVLLSAETSRNGAATIGKSLEGVESALRGQVVRRSKISAAKEVVKVKLPPGKTVQTALAEKWSQADSRVVAVEPNYRVHVELAPNDPQYPQMWGLNNTGQTGGTPDADIDAPEAWNTTTGSSNVIVCVIDTGVDFLHPDLAPNMWHNPDEIAGNGIDDDGNGYIDDVYGWDFVQNDNDPSDAAGHGSHVAGTIAARGNNSLGVTGVNWQCKIMACRFLDASGSGDTYDAIDCINYAVANGAKILSNSWGGGGYLASLEAAIVNARNNGVLFVAAAGNGYGSNNDTSPNYPSNYAVDNVIAVASTTNTDALSAFSNYGPTTVHLGAPGSSILSSVPPLVPLFVEDFQGAALPGFAGTQMTLQGPANRWGTVNDAVEVGNKAARGDLTSSPYQGGSDGSIVTPVLNTTGLRGLSVFCLIRIDSGQGDTISIDATSNGTTWTTLASLTNYEGFFLPDVYYAIQVDVPENLRGPTTRFRWRWTTDGVDNGFVGVEIDDIVIQYIGSDYSNAYDIYSGTSMATPHVSGVAALMLANDPTLTYAQLKSKIVNFGDPIPALAGKTISGRRLNANTALNPTPPTADDVSAATGVDTPTLITLVAHDDGLPTPPGAMTYIVTALPAHGSLADPNGGTIASVPYSLLNHGAQVRYTPASGFAGADSFTYKANDGGTAPTGGDSNIASVDISVISIIYAANMDSNPGWTLDTGWAWGTPTGSAGDPASGHTGSNVIGYNLNGAYENNMAGPRYATTPAIDCTGHTNVRLRFWRWLGVESSNYDHASVQVSIDGTNWTTVWDHSGISLNDTSWRYMEYALPAIVDNKPTVYLRWSMGPTDSSVTYQGWNIDDVEVVGERNNRTPFYTESLDTNPGWTVSGEWAFGTPTGQGGASYGFPDPTSGATGANVYGVNLNGDYTVAVGSPYYLTTGAINCSAQTNVQLQFKRWLNVDWGSYVSATVEVSVDGNSWTTIYANVADDETVDPAWQSVSYDISAVADHCATLYVRWSYQILRADAFPYSGWNIDDIVLSGESSCVPPAAPANPAPQNGATDVPVDTNLSWSGGSSASGVVINEIDIGGSDSVELYNPTSAAVDLTGWTLIAIDSRGYTTTFTLPTFTLNAGAYVVLHESLGTNTPTDLYFNNNIMWISGAACSASLVNAAGTGVDFVRWSSYDGSIASTDLPPAGTGWTGPDPLAPIDEVAHSLGRSGTSTDTDSGADWENTCGVDASIKTPGAANVSAPAAAAAVAPAGDKDPDRQAGGNGLEGVPAKLRGVVNSISGAARQQAIAAAVEAMNARAVAAAGGDTPAQSGSKAASPNAVAAVTVSRSAGTGQAPASLYNVALAAADLSAATADVQSKLLADGRFGSVTVIDTRAVTPTAAELAAFDGVMVWTNYAPLSSVSLGNSLADYVDAGGGVLLSMFAMAAAGTNGNIYTIEGRFLTDNYYCISRSPTAFTTGPATLGTVHVSGHPLLDGVSSFNGGTYGFRPPTAPVASATRVADWSTGEVLAAVRTDLAGPRADLGMWPCSSDADSYGWISSTDGARLMANAVAFVCGGSAPCQTTYDVYCDTNNPPTTLVASSLTGTTCDPGTLTGSTTYYWKVVAKDCCGQASSPVWSFTTTCTAPPAPANPSPADDATGVDVNADLSWNGGASALEALGPIGQRSQAERQALLASVVASAQDEQAKRGSPTIGAYSAAQLEALAGTVQILVFNKYADTNSGGEYENTLNAIAMHFTDFAVTPTVTEDPSVLATELAGKQVFLVPEQEQASASLDALGAAWAPVLQNFVTNGGTVIFCEQWGNSAGFVAATGLLNATFAGQLGGGNTLNVVNTSHPLTQGLSATIAGPDATGWYNLLSPDAVSLVQYSGSSVVAARDIGAGHVALIGFDYYAFNTDTARIVANAVQWSGSGACTTTYDVYFGTANPPTTQVASGLTSPTFDPGLLLANTTYYWQIVATNCCGQTPGLVWSFTTADSCLPPPAPSNPDPADGAVDVPPTSVLSWNGTGGYLETFNDGLAQGWQETTDAQWSVVAGEYRAQTGTASVTMQSLYTGQTVQDGYAQVTARRTGYKYSVSGLVMRASADFNLVTSTGSAYLLGISADGAFYVARYVAGTATFLQGGWATSNLLNRDLASNTLGMSIRGSSIKAYINGSLAWSGTDTGITGPGYVGLYNYSGSAPVAVHYYDNVLIGQPLDVDTTVPAVQAWYNEHTVPGSIYAAPAGLAAQPPAELLQAARPQVFTVPEAKKDVQPQATSSEAPTGSGGPDAGGYIFIDSDTPGGPAFNWIDIRETGTAMPLTDDSFYFPVALPFAFNFYGTGYNQLAVASNGTIYFENTYQGYANTPIPGNTGYGVNKYIAVYWDDLDPSSGGQVLYQVVGTAPNRILVVQWQNVPHCCGTADSVTMQAQLYEGSGHILLLYADASSEAGGGATVGIQRDTTTGLQYLYNQPVLHGELAVLFTRGVTYDVYLWSGDPAAQPPIPTASCLLTPSYDPGYLQCAETNYWLVVAKSPCGQTPGQRWSFNVFRRPGDANSDGHVDVVDLLSLVYAFGTCSGDPGFDPTCDFNTDGCVDSVDLLTILYNWDQ